ncbi:hypothetical protein [Photobacterium leiognathi]|uniref:hypothetical protein n=1 Tax=Photobacterium leiognathi TaxID=553611 RepID=UPI0027372019|nr:hypothetical protein [Photobacterium leiognathi]
MTHAASDKTEARTTNSLRATFRYYVSNSSSASLSAGVSKTEDNIDYNPVIQVPIEMMMSILPLLWCDSYRLK